MKNIIYLLSFLVFFILTNKYNAQTPYHKLDPNADKFAGTWTWGDSNNGITFILKKENNTQPFKNDNTILDSIIGFHKIYKNGQVTEDSTYYSNTSAIDMHQTSVGNTDDNNSDLLILFMHHKNKGIQVKISYIDSTHIKIVEVINQGGVRYIQPGQSPTDWSIDIPNNIILTKQ